MKVAVSGFCGRMGSEVVQAVGVADDLQLVGGADPAAGETSENDGQVWAKSLDELLQRTKPEVLVEFSLPSSVYENARRALEGGVAVVVGATGLTTGQRHSLGELAESKRLGILVAPNFAVGAVLMMEFAKRAAPHFAGVEIIELHHEKKLDAPSGTALLTAEKIGAGDNLRQQATEATGARGQIAHGVQIHSVRLPGYVAHQEVLLGNPGEALTIRHDSFDRKSFMPGVLLGIRRIRQRKGLVWGLESFLFE